MSSLWVVDQGEEILLDAVTDFNMTLGLYKNDVDSGLTDAQREALTESSFTEADFAGYASATLTGGSWTVTQGDPSVALYAKQTFTRSSTGTTQTIYGYYIRRASDSKLLWYEQFDAPIDVTNSSDAVEVTPLLTLEDRTSEDIAVTIGSVLLWPTATAPTNYLLCDGTAVSRTTYADLFATIGTTFGVGDGSTTFNVPDMLYRDPTADKASNTHLTATGGSNFSAATGSTYTTDGPTVSLTEGNWVIHTNGFWNWSTAATDKWRARLRNTTDGTNLHTTEHLAPGTNGQATMSMHGVLEVAAGATKVIQPQFNEATGVSGTSLMSDLRITAHSINESDDYLAANYVIRAL